MHAVSLTAWDMFAFPEEPEHWQEDFLSYIRGEEINMGGRMLGLHLVTANAGGQYGDHACILLYEGWMLAYDLSSNLAEWVPMHGVPTTLTVVELKSACNLSNIIPCPHLGGTSQTGEPAGPFGRLQEAGRKKCTVKLRTQTLKCGMKKKNRVTGHTVHPLCLGMKMQANMQQRPVVSPETMKRMLGDEDKTSASSVSATSP